MKVVNKAELALILDVSEETLTQWQKQGLPFAKGAGRGNSNQYETSEVIEWMIQRRLSKVPEQEGARDRLTRLQGDDIEMSLAEKRRLLIPAAEIEPAWAAMVVAARQSLLALPVRLAPIVIGMTDVDQVRELLDEQVNDALGKLASAGGDGGEGEGAVGASEEDPAVRVG